MASGFARLRYAVLAAALWAFLGRGRLFFAFFPDAAAVWLRGAPLARGFCAVFAEVPYLHSLPVGAHTMVSRLSGAPSGALFLLRLLLLALSPSVGWVVFCRGSPSAFCRLRDPLLCSPRSPSRLASEDAVLGLPRLLSRLCCLSL